MSECGSDVYNSLTNLKLNATNKFNNLFVPCNFGAEGDTPLTMFVHIFCIKLDFNRIPVSVAKT